MKRLLTILLSLVVFMAPAQAQVLKSIGKAAGTAAGAALLNKISSGIEKKADNFAEKTVNKVLGQNGADSLNAGGSKFEAIGKALTNAMEKSQSAQTATLRDFSEKNAARKEHNKTLVYDDWDI